MTDLELKYTLLKFCNIEGLVEDTNHAVKSCSSKEDFQKHYENMKYAIEKKFTNFAADLKTIETLLGGFNESVKSDIIKAFQELCYDIKDDNQYGKN